MSIKRILLIDNDVEEHDIFCHALKEFGDEFLCIALSDPRKALQALKNFELEPDIIFLDLDMPGMTGEDFLYGLEAFEHLPTIPIVIYSGSESMPHISPGWPGVKFVLQKPHSFHKLIAALNPILKGSESLLKK